MKSIQGEFPQAEVFASTFDQFVLQLSPVHDQLPVFTQEIGMLFTALQCRMRACACDYECHVFAAAPLLDQLPLRKLTCIRCV